MYGWFPSRWVQCYKFNSILHTWCALNQKGSQLRLFCWLVLQCFHSCNEIGLCLNLPKTFVVWRLLSQFCQLNVLVFIFCYSCPLLHRTAGDTERRYHLRYYKTCTCVYETDARGHCVKNGAHCAFAHGAQDLRPPSYDVRELQAMENAERQGSNITDSPLGSSLEKDRIINEDPRWNGEILIAVCVYVCV